VFAFFYQPIQLAHRPRQSRLPAANASSGSSNDRSSEQEIDFPPSVLPVPLYHKRAWPLGRGECPEAW